MRLDKVVKKYGSSYVLKNISLSVFENTSLLIEGPSGCGKTTLLRCMALVEKINEGYIEFLGRRVSSPDNPPPPERDVRLEIGMVFQHLYLWPHLTVLENVALPLRLVQKQPKRIADEKAVRVLDMLDISEKREEYPSRLSGGQQQRVAIARALVHSPKLLLLDEITSNLDRAASERVLEAIESVWHRGTTIVLASHQADRIPKSLKEVVLQYEAGEWKFKSAE